MYERCTRTHTHRVIYSNSSPTHRDSPHHFSGGVMHDMFTRKQQIRQTSATSAYYLNPSTDPLFISRLTTKIIFSAFEVPQKCFCLCLSPHPHLPFVHFSRSSLNLLLGGSLHMELFLSWSPRSLFSGQSNPS